MFPTPVGSLVARSLALLQDRQRFLGNQAEAVMTFSTGKVRHTFLGGFESPGKRRPVTVVD